MALHHIEPNKDTLVGSYSTDYPPILTINPGDTVVYRTLDADWIIDGTDLLKTPPKWLGDWKGNRPERINERDDGHALCGPIAVRGAKPGTMLIIHIKDIVPGTFGWSYPWYGTPFERKDELDLMVWSLDKASMTGSNRYGHTVKLIPFMGVMGLCPAEAGVHSTAPPRSVGGNLDCKELVAGTTLYLPVEVDEGMFYVGDGHARQGDGESSGTAIECPMERVELTFEVLENPPLKTAYANTPAGWLTFAFNEDLTKAAHDALEAMLTLMQSQLNIGRHDALSLAGVVVDLHVTQIVNGTRGIHALLPHDALLKE